MKKEPVFGRVAKIVVGAKKKGNVAWDLVNGVRGRILVDSGAEVGMVPRSLVGSDAVNCGEMHISGVLGKTSVYQSTI